LEYLKMLKGKFSFEYPELPVCEHVEYFNTLETYNERKAFVRELGHAQVVNLYRYFNDDTNKQKQLCRAIALKDLKRFTEELNFEESEVARSCLKEWNGM
jgi:hypothetical protein